MNMEARRCPTCRLSMDAPNAPTRNRFAERYLESRDLSIECGECKTMVPYGDFTQHEPQCKPKNFQCCLCKKAGLTIDECVECMKGHMNSDLDDAADGGGARGAVINISEFAIQNRYFDDSQDISLTSFGVRRLLSWTWFDTIVDGTSYLEPFSGCEYPQTLSEWLKTDHARQGYKEFKFDLESAKSPRTNPSVQYGMTHGFVVLLNDCTVQQPYNRRFPPVLLRFFKYQRYGTNFAFTINIMGNKSEIKWLKTIDNLCLVVKFTLKHAVPQEIIGERMRITGDNLFNSDNIYRVRCALLPNVPTMNDVGPLQPPSQSTDQLSMHVRFGIQAYNNLP